MNSFSMYITSVGTFPLDILWNTKSSVEFFLLYSIALNFPIPASVTSIYSFIDLKKKNVSSIVLATGETKNNDTMKLKELLFLFTQV